MVLQNVFHYLALKGTGEVILWSLTCATGKMHQESQRLIQFKNLSDRGQKQMFAERQQWE